MSSDAKKHDGALTRAASELEHELERYTRLSAELEGTEVSSAKTLARSKRLLAEASECEQRLGSLLGALLAAMNGARETQQRGMERTLAAAHRVQERAAELQALIERFTRLGLAAREVHVPVADAEAARRAGATPDAMAPALDDVRARMDAVIEEAEAIASAARQGDWPDVVRDASALRDQVRAVRNRLAQAQRDLAAQPRS